MAWLDVEAFGCCTCLYVCIASAVFVQNGNILKAKEEFNIQGKQISFYKYCPGTFGYILVHYIS